MEQKPLPSITLTPVESTQLAATGYDPESKILAITFRANPAGRTYYYHGVELETVEALARAPSIGTYFHRHIMFGYAYDRVEADGTVSKSWAPEAAPSESAPAQEAA